MKKKSTLKKKKVLKLLHLLWHLWFNRFYFLLYRFKNDKPYPWAQDTSSLILYPIAENQTIYTRTASFADAGNYTCVLRNDTHKSEHHIELNVQGN